MDKEKVIKIIQSAIDNLNDVFVRTDDEYVEDRVGETINDLVYLKETLENTNSN